MATTSKLLNLDELATENKVVVLDGKDHPMRELTVQEFINKAREAGALNAKLLADDEATVEAKMAAVVGMVDEAFPTVTAERLGKLTLAQLNAILAFAFATPAQIEAEVAAAQEKAPGNG